MNSRLLVFAAALVFCVPSVRAQTFDVKQLEVEQGALELEIENAFNRGVPHALGPDASRTAHEVLLSYGATSLWRVIGAIGFEKPEEDAFRASEISFQSVLVFKAIDDEKHMDAGLGWFAAVEASIHHETTNALVFGPIVTLKAERLSFTANPFFEKTFGRNREDGIAFDYGWQLKYDVRKGFAVGIEGFGAIENLGDAPPLTEQEHRIGPAVFTELKLAENVTILPSFGLLFGLTEATPDVALKLNVEVPLYEPPGSHH